MANAYYMAETNTTLQSNYPPIKNKKYKCKKKKKKERKKTHCLIQCHQNLYLSTVFSVFMTSWVGIKFLILRVTPFLFKDFVYVSFI